jgi:hypothetical protein
MGANYIKTSKEFKVSNKEQLYERMNVIVKAVRNRDLNFNKVIRKTTKSKTLKVLSSKYLENSKFPTTFSTNFSKKKNNKIKYKLIDEMPNKLKEILRECNSINYDKKIFLTSIAFRPIIEFSINYYFNKVKKMEEEK